MTLGHPESCACACCAPPTQDSTSDTDTPTPPGVSGATKPVYSKAEVVYALRTADGQWGSVAWADNDISYSVGTGSVTPGTPYYANEYSGYVGMTSGMEGVATKTFELWDDLVAIDLNPVVNDPTADVIFNYSSNTSGNGTYAHQTYSSNSGGRANWGLTQSKLWFSNSWWTHDSDSDLYNGGYGVMTYLHEIGHALGLSHPGGYNGSGSFGADATHFQDTRAYTLMSYFDASSNGSGTSHGSTYASTPLLHDILAVQEIYGADMTTRVGATTYGFNSTANRDAFNFNVNSSPVVAIWDAGGIDKIDVSGWWSNQVVDLREGAFSSVGFLSNNLAIAYGAEIEQAAGGSGSDVLIGNALDNVLTGNNGNDTLTGDEGSDVLFGGAGSDRLDGGDGVDWARYANSGSGVTLNLSTGSGSGGEAGGDVLIDIEHVSGSNHGDAITGDNATANQLFGLGGNDVLTGLGGHDFLLGHGGNDSIYGGSGRDILRGGEGADLLDG
ncbi:MAG: M10 family metallopeptidase C-terminal domain-containing protein, partial [Pseudomonadota bacterium]